MLISQVIVLQYGEAQASVLSAAYTVTVVTVSLGILSAAGWEDFHVQGYPGRAAGGCE